MSSPIALRGFDEDQYRQYVRTPSEEALVKEGKELRWLSGDGKIVGTIPGVFYEQLRICCEEYRRRHPRT